MEKLLKRTFWKVDEYSFNDYDGDYLRERVSEERGYLVSSLCESGRHAPAIDFDFRIMIREEPIGPDNQLDFFRPVPIDRLYGLFLVFTECGFVDKRELKSVGNYNFSLSYFHDRGLFNFSPHLIAPFRLLPSSTAGHFHLYIDQEIEWPQYKELLIRLTGAGLIEENYLAACLKHTKSFLLKPGITKNDIMRMQQRGRVPAKF